MYFTDRTDAGRRLAARLTGLKGQDLVVLGLPRGGVPVAAEVADALDAPLDICLVRKLGVPYQPELAMGAIGENGVRVLNDRVLSDAGVSPQALAEVETRERAVLEERTRRYAAARGAADPRGRTAVVVDDGLATGATALAACQVVRARGAARIVLAVPVAPHDWVARVGGAADETYSVREPQLFYAIGQFYTDFSQTTDEEVVACLRARREGRGERAGYAEDAEVRIPLGGSEAGGRLTLPERATGIVLFAHGSGSSRHSPRNLAVAAALNRAGLGTLLFDLLTEAEAADRAKVFDTPLLARRLRQASDWLTGRYGAGALSTGYFGASTGAAAALWAAAEPDDGVAAVVSRGGRPDLADERLPEVTAPTLLIVGGADPLVLDLNERAQRRLRCEHRLVTVPGAGHLFEEPGQLERVGELAAAWFAERL
ncbi:phosphoribosyltransferase family protein [Streptomyces showdoensis]|uniref:Phosphoribosyl transferase n=1 Tax=Streptomyces showdoensis TaxID=68268 RepID=A0A2P2GV13_STREW|nr:phosphoribosyltransferase family protein [Streptomyces showdoensis]KKZ75327.1 phosphoribosyl transferase [Streptomyces showdoensis]